MDDFVDPRGQGGFVPAPVRVPHGQQPGHALPLLVVRRAGIIRQGPKRIPPVVLRHPVQWLFG
eukprot:12788808-Heterocapsa_arctica.AAC.1